MSPYIFGTRSDETRALQQALVELGLYAGEIDGIFGHATEAAVAAARASFALGAGGVDAALLERLGLAPPKPNNPIQNFVLRQAAALFFSQLKGLFAMTFLAGYRTYIVAALMLLTGLAGVVGIDIPNFTGQAPGNLVMEALAFFFLRQGLKTGS